MGRLGGATFNLHLILDQTRQEGMEYTKAKTFLFYELSLKVWRIKETQKKIERIKMMVI